MSRVNGVMLYVFLYSFSSLGNRLADPQYRKHCTGLTRDVCVQQLNDAKEVGCITGEEHRYGSTQPDLVVPTCTIKTWNFIGWCFCSCFAKGTPVFVENIQTKAREWVAIDIVVEKHSQYRFVTPSKHATMRNMTFTTSDISYWSAGNEDTLLFVLRFDDFSELALTGNHSVLMENGKWIEAASVKVGDMLVGQDGSKVRITAVEMRAAKDEVYNVWINSDEQNSHIIFAGGPNGLAVGDALWENSSEEEVTSFRFQN